MLKALYLWRYINMKMNIYDEIKEAKRCREDQIAKLRDGMADAARRKERAEAKAAEALKNNDAGSYTAAKAEIRAAEDTMEFYKIKLEEFDESALFNNVDLLRSKAAEVEDSVSKKKNEAFPRIVKYAKDARKELSEIGQEIDRANEALKDLSGKSKTRIPAYPTDQKIAINGMINSIDRLLSTNILKPYILG